MRFLSRLFGAAPVLIAALAIPLSVSAFGLSGEQLKEHCDYELRADIYKNEGFHLSACSYYVGGVFDGIYQKARAWEFCWPESVTPNQVTLVVAKHLNDHPEELHLRASALVVKAVEDAWPCE